MAVVCRSASGGVFVTNLFFTALYLAIGVGHFKGAESRSVGSKILIAFKWTKTVAI